MESDLKLFFPEKVIIKGNNDERYDRLGYPELKKYAIFHN